MDIRKLITCLITLLVGLLLGYFIACLTEDNEGVNELCNRVEDSGYTLEQIEDAIKSLDTSQINDCCNICTDDFQICGLTDEFLFGSMANYARHVWRKTSTFTIPQNTIEDLYFDDNKLDARLVRFDFEQLQKYLCYLRKKAASQGKEVKYLDAVYIRYTDKQKSDMRNLSDLRLDPDLLEAYGTPAIVDELPGIHSLAFVPFANNINDTTVEYWNDNTILAPSSGCQSSIKNHGWVCPPPRCESAPEGYIIKKADEILFPPPPSGGSPTW